MVELHSSNFRVITTNFLGVWIFRKFTVSLTNVTHKWTASSEFGTYSLCEQRRFRRACASAQSRQNLRCSLIQAVSQEEPSDRKPDPCPLWMAGHAQLKFVMTECSKTQFAWGGSNAWLLDYLIWGGEHTDNNIMPRIALECDVLHTVN